MNTIPDIKNHSWAAIRCQASALPAFLHSKGHLVLITDSLDITALLPESEVKNFVDSKANTMHKDTRNHLIISTTGTAALRECLKAIQAVDDFEYILYCPKESKEATVTYLTKNMMITDDSDNKTHKKITIKQPKAHTQGIAIQIGEDQTITGQAYQTPETINGKWAASVGAEKYLQNAKES